ncbi:MAG: metal-dependent hydrolase [Halofilum sp. (in: g-proteobacteria)]|nr:metal-dependent hydrolase [Halofilum sp. (in: g-proteobacteria)]
MDSVTQIVFGAAVGGAVAGRRAGWRGFAWGAAVGTMPDLDSFYDYGGPVANFTWHRGYTHSLFVQTLAAPLIAWPIERLHRHLGVGYRRWLAAVWLILITHALLDAFTIYGTQLLLPFSDHPFGLGSIFIIDPAYTLPLIVGVVGALWLRRDWERARRWNLAGLLISTLYLGWGVTAQQWVEHRAQAAIEQADLPAERMLATPTAVNSLLWRIVAVGEDAHWEALHLLGSDEPIEFRRYPNQRQLLEGIEDQWAVRRLQDFTHGFYAVTEEDGRVVISDLRMGQVGFYAFAYAVGRVEDGRTVAIDDARHSTSRPDPFTMLDDLFACARGIATEVMHCGTSMPR